MTIKKDCPIGKILNILTNRCVNIDGKIGKEIIKKLTLISNKDNKKDNKKDDKKEKRNLKYTIVNDKSNNTYFIINNSIIDNLDKNDVILDPAGLSFMKTSFIGAGWASHAIYQLLSQSKPNPDVIKHFEKFKNEDYLYEKNKSNLSIAYYSSYNNNIKIIHAVGPDFRYSSYLKKIINNYDLTDLYNLMFKIYNDIYKTFINEYNKNNSLQLRLLPISTGAFINFNKDNKIKIFKCLKTIYQSLNKKYDIKPIIFFYDKEDYKLFKDIILI